MGSKPVRKGTYVYCVIANERPPRLTRVARGLAGAGPVHSLEISRGLFAIVTTVPFSRYGEQAIHRGLSNLDWVSRAAVAHEAVVESFKTAAAVLPMKLFTIFDSDARVVAYLRAQQTRLARIAKVVANHDEFGVRVALDGAAGQRARARAAAAVREPPVRTPGIAYLRRKKARRDAAIELAQRGREVVAALYDRLSARARRARRRAAREIPVQDGPLLLDAAFLVPRNRSAAFRAQAAREARALARTGYGLTLTGPWPPYTFVHD